MKKMIPFFDLSRQNKTLYSDFMKAFSDVLKNSEFTYGKATQVFEKKFAQLHDAKYAVALRSGTASLWAALKAVGLENGDEVITTPATFSATADTIVLAGGKPVFVDVLPEDGNIDPQQVNKKITKKTKAILVVHLYGIPADMTALKKIARQKKLALIEDASHAHGSEYKGKKVGSFGDVACFSLYPSKTLGALGNAGVVTTQKKSLRERVEMFAHHGIKDKKRKYNHQAIGMNELIDNVQAAFLLKKLPYFSKWIKTRRKIVQRYNTVFQKYGHPGMQWAKDKNPNFYVYAVQMKKRKQFQTFMQKEGVSTGVYYPVPLHRQPSFSYLGHRKGAFPVAEKFLNQTISLPLFPELTESEIRKIEKAIKAFFEKYGK